MPTFILFLVLGSSTFAHAQVIPNYLIVSIKIIGPVRTQPQIGLREVPMRVGDTFAPLVYAKLRAAGARNLQNSGLYNVDGVQDSVSPDGWVYLSYIARDRFPYSGSAGVRVAGQNVNAWIKERDYGRLQARASVSHNNLFGLAHGFSLSGYLGWRRGLSATYRAPYLGKNLRWGLSAFGGYGKGREAITAVRGDTAQFFRTRDRYVIATSNAGIGINYRPKYYVGHNLNFSWSRTEVDDTLTGFAEPNYLQNDARSSLNIFNINYTLVYEGRDLVVYPLKGKHLRGGPGLFYMPNTSKPWLPSANLVAAGYRALGRNWFGAAVYQVQAVLGENVPFLLQPYLGIRYHIRGYETIPVVGRAYGLAQHEIKWRAINRTIELPIVPTSLSTVPYQVFLKGFADIGTSLDDRSYPSNTLNNKALYSGGLGADLRIMNSIVFRLEGSINGLKQGHLFLSLVGLY